MKIQDISDRVYQGQVYALLDQAQSSIVISMYLIRTGEDPRHPVNRLLDDLLEARQRGVQVTIYLNTRFKGFKPEMFLKELWLRKFKEAGIAVHLVSPVRRLHDKLIIVDRRFVVEGSTNWSVSAIAENLESATLIESQELAEAKLRRLAFFPLWGEEAKKTLRTKPPKAVADPLFPAGASPSIEVPAAFLEKERYFPRMISNQSERALKVLLLLIYLAESKGLTRFYFSAEAAASFLGILHGGDRTALRRQMVRVLRELEGFGVLKSEFHHGKETRIELRFPPGPTFTVGVEDFEAGELAVLTDNEIFLRLVRARLRAEGKRPEDFSSSAIQKRFFIYRKTYQRTLKQTRKAAPSPL